MYAFGCRPSLKKPASLKIFIGPSNISTQFLVCFQNFTENVAVSLLKFSQVLFSCVSLFFYDLLCNITWYVMI